MIISILFAIFGYFLGVWVTTHLYKRKGYQIAQTTDTSDTSDIEITIEKPTYERF
jgi:hypothetical protein